MFNKLGAQLYTIRDFMNTPEEVRASFKRLKSMGYDQGQTAGAKIPYDVFGQIALEEGIELVGTHESFQRMVENFDEAVKVQEQLHCGIMGIGGSGRDLTDDDILAGFIADVNEVCRKLKPLGMPFSYHNHSAEFLKHANGKTTMELLVEGFDKDATFCLDTYWVQNGGGDVRHWIDMLANRIDVLHLKDMKKSMHENDWQKTYYCEIGQGNLWWEGIMESAEKANVKYYVVEQDFSEDPFKSLETSSNYLHKNFMK